MRNTLVTWLVTAFAFLSILSSPASAAGGEAAESAEAVRIILVLDASGSMWGRIEGKAKIEIAREVLVDLIHDLPDEGAVGLVAYGHRREGDCGDVEELVPLGPTDKRLLVGKIGKINPRGKTPITRSIRMTAEKLKGAEDETDIILVSDGKETCEGDPCALVRELKAAGARFTMYVIGFDVTGEEKAQLECMAEAGGGRYFTARNAGEFRAATREAVSESRNFGYLKVTALRNGDPVSARIDIYAGGGKEPVGSARTVVDPGRPGARLQPGVYDLTVTDDRMKPPRKVAVPGVEIAAGRTTEKTADFSGGSLRVEVLANGEKASAGLYVFEAGTKTRVVTGDTSRDNPRTFPLSPGVYDLQVIYRKVKPEAERRFPGVEIEAGRTVEKRVEFGEGRLSVEALVNGGRGSAGLYIFEAGTDRRVASGDTSRDNPKIFTLSAGTYDLKAAYRKSVPEVETTLENIAVVQGETTEKRFEFQAGVLEMHVNSGGEPTRGGLTFFRPGESKRIGGGDAGKAIKMQPGEYEVVVRAYKLEGKPEKRLSFTIEAGRTTTRDVEFP